MAQKPRTRSPKAKDAPAAAPAMQSKQSILVNMDQLVPYAHNPRDNSKAIDSVAESIKAYGFLVPIVADSKGVIVAGHTRYAAATKLGLTQVPVIYADHLDEKQLQAFRIVDNKTAELAEWDFDLLSQEISELRQSGIDLLPFGWTQEELDCLGEVVGADCLSDVLDEDKAVQEGQVIDRRSNGGGDGVNGAIQANKGSNVVSKDPKSVRVAVGEINFFVDIEEYREWAHEVRRTNGFDMSRVIADLATRLGLSHRPLARTAKQEQEEKEAMALAVAQEAEATGKDRKEVKREASIRKRTVKKTEATLRKAVDEAEG